MFQGRVYDLQLKELYDCRRHGIRPSLPPVIKLLDILGNPHRKTRFIHVAGTNGKGSTTAYIEAILRKAGYRTGSFFSPHILDFRERIRLDGKFASKKLISDSLGEIGLSYMRSAGNKNKFPGDITFFEWTVALAFYIFAKARVDYAVVETGMGGRFDATNVIEPLVSVITSISVEHSAYLGRTQAAIAFEKAGIIKRGRPAVCGIVSASAAKAISAAAKRKRSPISFSGNDFSIDTENNFSSPLAPPIRLEPRMLGKYQYLNAALAAQAVLTAGIPKINPRAIQKGIRSVNLPGRFEIKRMRGRTRVYDVAHNPGALRNFIPELIKRFPGMRFDIVFSVLRGKDRSSMLKLLAPIARRMAVVTPDDFRAIDGVKSAGRAVEIGIKAKAVDSGGLRKFLSGKSGDPILVTGSFTVVEMVKKLDDNR